MYIKIKNTNNTEYIINTDEVSHIYETTDNNRISDFANDLASGKKAEIKRFSVIVMKNGSMLSSEEKLEKLWEMLK